VNVDLLLEPVISYCSLTVVILMLNRRAIGFEGERRAVEFLKTEGFRILKTNYRTKMGEIDIIAKKDDLIAFVEVKTRHSYAYGRPEEAVDRRKRKRIIKAAKYYLIENDLYDKQDIRFDVLSLTTKKSTFEIDYFENAFREER